MNTLFLFFIFLNFGNVFMYKLNVNNNNQKLYCNTVTDYKNKKLINIHPGGLRGFYSLGVGKYLKENYDLSDYIFSGASAGAWNALFMVFKGDDDKFIDNIFNIDYYSANSIQKIEYLLKDTILSNYNESDFDLDRLVIGVSVLDKIICLKKELYCEFKQLEDVIDCCIASSHIPFLTGGLFRKYRKKFSFDGGFKKYPFLDSVRPSFEIKPTTWLHDKEAEAAMTDTLQRKHINYRGLYCHGYKMSESNKDELDKLLL